MESENIVLTQADYFRLMGDLSLLFDAVRELSGTISSYESAGFISKENITEARDYAEKCLSLDKYWSRAIYATHARMPEKRKEKHEICRQQEQNCQ